MGFIVGGGGTTDHNALTNKHLIIQLAIQGLQTN